MPISVEAYHRMQERDLIPKRAELIRGVITEKMSKSPLHRRLTRRLSRILEQWAGERYLVLKEDPLTLADSEPEPDVAVVAGQESDYDEKHPVTALVVAEVSVTSEASDREMLGAYARAGVSEVWLVLGARQQVERFAHPAGDRYTESRLFSTHDTLTSTALPGFSLPLSSLFQSGPARRQAS